MAAKQRMSEGHWRTVVREQESSGRTVKEFARSRGLSAATLYWWRSALGRRGAPKSDRIRLAPVTVVGSTTSNRESSGADFEVVLRSGRRVFVPDCFDADALRRLVAVLEQGC